MSITHRSLVARIRVAGLALLAGSVGLISTGCSNKTCTGFEAPARQEDRLQLVADFGPNQVTGVAVSSNGRMFVNFPDWRQLNGVEAAMHVAEVMPDGSIRPYPNAEWNGLAEAAALVGGVMGAGWDGSGEEGGSAPARAEIGTTAVGSNAGRSDSLFNDDPDRPDPGVLPGDRFVCVQSVHVDSRDRLWILDASNPSFAGVQLVGGGPKLIEVDLRTNAVARVIRFDSDVVPFNAYLNDVRVDPAEEVAFITDSGLGAIIVVDLVSHRARRLLDRHVSTKADPTLVPIVGGSPWRSADSGQVPQIHSDGIALDEKNKILYWQSLTCDRLYAIDSRILSSRTVPDWQITNSVRDLGQTCVTDGMWCDSFGDVYFTSIETDSVTRLAGSDVRRAFRRGVSNDWRPAIRTVVQDARLGWPDSLAIGPVGPTGPEGRRQPGGQFLYVTTSQIHRVPAFEGGRTRPPADPTTGSMGYAVYRVRLP